MHSLLVVCTSVSYKTSATVMWRCGQTQFQFFTVASVSISVFVLQPVDVHFFELMARTERTFRNSDTDNWQHIDRSVYYSHVHFNRVTLTFCLQQLP